MMDAQKHCHVHEQRVLNLPAVFSDQILKTHIMNHVNIHVCMKF